MYNYNSPWDPLKLVCLGRSYPVEFYNDIKDNKVKDTLSKIAAETEEDYLGIEKILTSLGVEVVRPTIKEKSIMDFVDQSTGKIDHSIANSFTLIPRPPMQPRDSQLIIGNKFIATNPEIECFSDSVDGYTVAPFTFDAPYVTVIGKDLIVDQRDQPLLGKYIQEQFPDHRVTAVEIGGHNDAVFAPVKPGMIVSTYYHTNYEETFPGWEVLYIENQSWNAVPDWRKFKHSNKGKWWMPGEADNSEFSNFVETWLNNWLGFVEETVFDVNMLVVNENTVLVNNYNKEVFDYLKRHNMEAIIAPFRHRFFWDGGIHCITSDLYREGNAVEYIKR